MDPITTETIAAVRKILGLDVKKITRAVESIRTWLEQQPHLPKQIDDNYLERVLTRSKGSVERAKETIDMYYTLRTALPEFFSNRDPNEEWFKRITSVTAFVPLPTLTKDFERVTLVNYLDPDGTKFAVTDSIKMSFMAVDIRLRDDYSVSDILVVDLQNFSVQHLTKYSLPILKKIEVCSFRMFSSRVKAIHIINAPTFVDATVSMVKQIVKQKIASRNMKCQDCACGIHSQLQYSNMNSDGYGDDDPIGVTSKNIDMYLSSGTDMETSGRINKIHVHRKGGDTLKQFLSPEILPEEYGGQAGKLGDLWGAWIKKIETNRDWFLEQEQLKSDESKRQGKTVDTGELFGFQGSFRRLSLD